MFNSSQCSLYGKTDFRYLYCYLPLIKGSIFLQAPRFGVVYILGYRAVDSRSSQEVYREMNMAVRGTYVLSTDLEIEAFLFVL